MVESPSDRGQAPNSTPSTGTPRWVKFGIVALVVALLFAILMLSGLVGEHGPGRHAVSGDTSVGGGTRR